MIRPLLVLSVAAAALLAPAATRAQAPVFAPVAGTGCVAQPLPGSEDPPPGGCQLTGSQLLGASTLALTGDQQALFALSGTGGVATLAPQAGGGLAFAGCISDDATSGVPGSYGACADGDALGPPLRVAEDVVSDLALSPDGRNLYVADPAGVAWLTRTAEGLVPAGCATEAARGDRCTPTAMLGYPSAIAVSPDGRNVYVADAVRDAVVTFTRDPETGALSAAGCISESGSDGLCVKGAGLYHPTGLAVAPDGSAVYAVGTLLTDVGDVDARSALAVLVRDPGSGRLAPGSCAVAVGAGSGSCVAAPNLFAAGDVTISPDGRFLYTVPAVDSDDGAVAAFAISGTQVAPAGCVVSVYDEAEADAAGACVAVLDLDTPRALAISPTGTLAVLAASGGLFGFARDPATGALSEAWCVSGEAGTCAATSEDGDASFDGAAFSPDGQRLYAAASGRNAVFALVPTAGVARSARVRAGARSARLRVTCPRAVRGGCRGTLRLGTSRTGYVLGRGQGRRIAVRLPAALRRTLRRAHAAEPAVTLEGERRLAATQRVRLTVR